MITSEILVKCPGKPVRRIIFARWDNRRRQRLALRMHAMGFPLSVIRCATRFSEAGLAKVLGQVRPVAPPSKPSIWGDFADCLRSELARVA